MKARFAILAALALAAPPAWGQSWQAVESFFLGQGRGELMTNCDFGRQYNSMGVSYWDYANTKRREAAARARGFNPSLIEAYAAGQAAAMAKVCPDVR